MIDKVQKIREEVERLKIQNETYVDKEYTESEKWSKHGAYHILFKLLDFIDSLPEEPVSDDFTIALAECINQAQCSVVDPMAHAEIWKDELIKLAKCEEPVSEDLEEASKEWLRPQLDKSYVNYGEVKMMELTHFDGYAMLDAIEFGAKWQKAKDESTTEDLGEYINELSKQFPEVSFAKLSRIAVRVAKWQKSNLWKPADGDYLPEIDREVIALLNDGKVVFAHRPYKGKYIGKNLTTGNIETFENETYDKGGWNIPNVKYWLDVELPKEI